MLCYSGECYRAIMALLFISVFCSQIFALKLYLRPNWSDVCNFYRKVIFLINIYIYKKKYILLFFADFYLILIFHNIVKSSENLYKWKLLKTCCLLIYPIIFIDSARRH